MVSEHRPPARSSTRAAAGVSFVPSVEPQPIRNGSKGLDHFQDPRGRKSQCSSVDLEAGEVATCQAPGSVLGAAKQAVTSPFCRQGDRGSRKGSATLHGGLADYR